ncbi:MAG: lipopolysaccharide heptosyltransferase II, partial [Pseudomonadota bacterium]|nr:lipopolysaccharide heptosyltransferase II [Pseudomonadota bacterium]
LHRKAFARAIVLPGSWKSALVPWLAKIPRRTGFVGEQRWGLLNDIRRLDKSRLPLNVQRFVALGLSADAPPPEKHPYPALTADPESRARAVEKFAIDPARPLLALCPGAEYGPAKRWPEEHFAAVAGAKAAAGWQVLLFGSDKERPISAGIDRLSGGRCVDLAGRTSLGEVIDLMSLSEAVVSNDSGLMHVAAALGRKLIALYGSSSPDFTPPLGDTCEVLRLHLPCSPCFKRECPLGHLDCLNRLSPARVLERIP